MNVTLVTFFEEFVAKWNETGNEQPGGGCPLSLRGRGVVNSPRGQKHCGRFQAVAPRQFADAKDDPVVLRSRQPGVGLEKPIPDRENGCVIAAPLCERDGMVDSVHVDRDQDRLQTPLQPFRQSNVAVLDGLDGECRESVSQRGCGWYAEQDYRYPQDARVEKMLDRMQAD